MASAAFEFATAGRIRFGRGVAGELPDLLQPLGQFALLLTGGDAARSQHLQRTLRERNLTLTQHAIAAEPTVDDVAEAVAVARRSGSTAVVAVGGGSVIDVGKAVAALLTNHDELSDYLEVVGRGRPLEEPAASLIAVPTTAGTGSEVTRNAVMRVPAKAVKVSLRSPLMLPRLALVDPELTLSMPPALTAATGLDALTQLIEPFVSVAANPLTDALCSQGIRRAARSLKAAFRAGDDLDAREDMCLASLFGGLALANAKLGAVHGFAGPIGGLFPDAPHGAICGRLLPLVIEVNVRALKERRPRSPALERYRELARLLTGDPEAKIIDGLIWLQSLCLELGLAPLARYGVSEDHVAELVEKARRASSMQGNPIKLSREELGGVLKKEIELG